MCKECDWKPNHEVVLHKCDCGNVWWAKAAKQDDADRISYRCVKCDALYDRKLKLIHASLPMQTLQG